MTVNEASSNVLASYGERLLTRDTPGRFNVSYKCKWAHRRSCRGLPTCIWHLELENLLHIRIADILALLLIHSFVFHVFVVFIYLFNDVSICVVSSRSDCSLNWMFVLKNHLTFTFKLKYLHSLSFKLNELSWIQSIFHEHTKKLTITYLPFILSHTVITQQRES